MPKISNVQLIEQCGNPRSTKQCSNPRSARKGVAILDPQKPVRQSLIRKKSVAILDPQEQCSNPRSAITSQYVARFSNSSKKNDFQKIHNSIHHRVLGWCQKKSFNGMENTRPPLGSQKVTEQFCYCSKRYLNVQNQLKSKFQSKDWQLSSPNRKVKLF